MTAVVCHVRGCDQPVADGFVCQRCADQLVKDLHRIIRGQLSGVVVDQVEDDLYRVLVTSRVQVQVGVREGAPVAAVQIRTGDYARTSSSVFDHRGLDDDLDVTFTGNMRGWQERAGRIRFELARTLVIYARQVAAARDVALPDDAEPLTVAVWLERHVAWLRGQELGGRAVSDIAVIVKRVMRAVDRPADAHYAGPCTAEPADEPDGYCGEDLYAKPDAPTVTCRRCGQRYDVQERRRWLVTAAEDQLAHAEWIGRAAASFGVDVTPAAIRGYAHRGRIVAHGRDRLGRPLYRIGDVVRVVEEIAVRRSRKAAG